MTEALFATRWVHLFEQDTAAGDVYAPIEGDIPLSRRPRAQLSLHPDGAATLFLPGPDDRLVPHAACWTTPGSPSAVRAAGGDELRILERSPARLVIARAR